MQVKIGIKGLTQTKRKLLMGVAQQNNKRGMYMKAVIQYHAWIQKNFNKQGGMHDGAFGPWKKLSDSTIRQRTKGKTSGGNVMILSDTGALRQKWALSANQKQGKVKSRQDYSSYHEEGNGNRPPRRKIFPSKRQGNKIIKRVYQQHLNKIWRNF